MDRESLIRLVTVLQNTRLSLINAGNVPQETIDNLTKEILELQKRIDKSRPSTEFDDMN